MIGIKNQSSPRKIGTPYLIQCNRSFQQSTTTKTTRIEPNTESLPFATQGSRSIPSRSLRLSPWSSGRYWKRSNRVVVCFRSRCRDSKNRPFETSCDSGIAEERGVISPDHVQQGLQKSNQRKLRRPRSDLRPQYWPLSCNWSSGTRYGSNHAQESILKAPSRK